jgi:lysylphosphatidylglycerol synthetase-like protein (DUF2156 family)
LTHVLVLVAAIFTGLLLLRLAGQQRRSAMRYAPVIIVAMAAILFAARGRLLLALLFGAGAAAIWFLSNLPPRRATQERRRPMGSTAMSEAQARAILGVAPGASEADIRSAFRRCMARAHPDQGGSTEEAARISAARDTLLKRTWTPFRS